MLATSHLRSLRQYLSVYRIETLAGDRTCCDTLIPKSVAISPCYNKYPASVWFQLIQLSRLYSILQNKCCCLILRLDIHIQDCIRCKNYYFNSTF